MNLRPYITTMLIWLSLIIGEVHTLVEDVNSTSNWIISKYIPMTLQWNFKMMGDEIVGVLLALAMLFYEKNRINRTTVKVFFVFYVLDFAMYFYNYKQKPEYGWVYLIILIAWILIYNHGSSRTKNRSGITTTT